MIIGVGGGGCKMARALRRRAKTDSIKEAIYMFADHRQPDIDYFRLANDTTVFLNLYNIDLYNDLPEDFFEGVEKVYVLAGLGGRTGTAWTPVIAQFAKYIRDVKSVSAVVSTPFIFEGKRHMIRANEGAAKIKELNIDLIITINNEELSEKYKGLNFINAFDYADKAVLKAVE